MATAEVRQPESLDAHDKDYKPKAWQAYTLQELGNFVHLLAKRANHRSDLEKRKKDLLDARNYWRMMGSWLDMLDEGVAIDIGG